LEELNSKISRNDGEIRKIHDKIAYIQAEMIDEDPANISYLEDECKKENGRLTLF
jgi:hypothetical protein